MGLIQIDSAKCKKDGICVVECPATIIQQKDKEHFPEMVAGGSQVCLACGHCVAVCPHGALSHTKSPREECPPIDTDLAIDQKEAVQFLRSRRSIRNFKKRPVEKQTIQYLIEQARYAPTGANTQTVAWTVHADRDNIKAIADLTIQWLRDFVKSRRESGKSVVPYFPKFIAAYDAGFDTITYNAPCLITASAPGNNFGGMTDLTIALTYLELIAVPSGLGTCWGGMVKNALHASAPLKDLVGLPEGHTHFYPMMIGYPRFRYHRLPERKPPQINWK
jgi:nitroreductase/NAD-dependent dihydropyrimidine dehydrogenase PreA subunit